MALYGLNYSAYFFQNLLFSKNSLSNTIRASNGLNPDQDRQSVNPDLGSNYLQRLSTDKNSCD